MDQQLKGHCLSKNWCDIITSLPPPSKQNNKKDDLQYVPIDPPPPTASPLSGDAMTVASLYSMLNGWVKLELLDFFGTRVR